MSIGHDWVSVQYDWKGDTNASDGRDLSGWECSRCGGWVLSMTRDMSGPRNLVLDGKILYDALCEDVVVSFVMEEP